MKPHSWDPYAKLLDFERSGEGIHYFSYTKWCHSIAIYFCDALENSVVTVLLPELDFRESCSYNHNKNFQNLMIFTIGYPTL